MLTNLPTTVSFAFSHNLLFPSFMFQILPVLIQSIAAFPVIFLAVISLSHWNLKHTEGYAVAVFVAYAVIFFAIAIMPTGGDRPWVFDRFAR